MTADRTLGIVLVNYHSAALLAANLAGPGVGGPHDMVVVVDNSEALAERAATARLCAEQGWHLVALPDNPGFGAGMDAGIAAARAAGCTAFLLLNPDAVVTQEVVDQLREHSLREPLAVIAPRIVDSTGAVVFQGARLHLRDGRIRSRRAGDPAHPPAGWVDWLTGACLVVHAELLDRMGGFDHDYFLYWEDVDLTYRAQLAGGHLVIRDDLSVRHDEGGTQGARRGRAKSATYYRYNARNRLLFGARHLDRRRLLGWVLRTPAVSREILLRGGRRQLLESSRPLRAIVRGSLEGVVIAVRALAARQRASVTRPAPLLVAHPGAELYGSDRVLADSVAAFVDAGHPVTVVLPGEGPLVARLEALGARVVRCRMPVLRKSALSPRGLLELAVEGLAGLPRAVRLVAAARGGVYVNTVTIPSWVVLGRLAGRRVLCHVHEAERSAPRWARWVLALPARLAGTVVVNSSFSLDVLAESAPSLRGRATVLANSVPGPPVVQPARPALSGSLRLLFLGRLSERKGPQVAVATLAELVRRGVDARLDLLGAVFPGYEWFEEQLHRSVADAGLTDRVRFLGFRSDIWDVVAGTDVVLVPSVVDEPFGNTAVEAVLAARPLVVSATSGLREAAAGYRSAQAVPPGEPLLWADAVQRIAADWPAVRRLAAEDAATAAQRHSPARYRRRLAELLDGPAGDGRA
ncbi:glycosyltransferase [Modestobacter sp. SYSU DS0511]